MKYNLYLEYIKKQGGENARAGIYLLYDHRYHSSFYSLDSIYDHLLEIYINESMRSVKYV